MAQTNVESIHSEENVLGLSVDLLVDTQQTWVYLLGPIADKGLIASDPNILAFAEPQTVCPYLLENPTRKARSVCLAFEKQSDQHEQRFPRILEKGGDRLG